MNGTKALWVALAVLTAAPAGAGAPAQVTVAGSWISGDWGSGVDTERQSAVVRFVWGGRTRLIGDLEIVDVRSDGIVVVQTSLGPVAIGHRGGPGAGTGPGGDSDPSEGSNSGNGGTGNTGSGSGPEGPTDPEAPPGETETVTLVEERSNGVGDLRLGVQRTLAGGDGRRFRLDAGLGVKVPTAEEEEYLGTGEWDYRVGVGGEYELWSGRLFGGVAWNRLGDPPWAVLEDVLDAYFGMASDPLAGGLVVAGWLEANQEVLAGTGGRTAAGVSVRGSGRLRWWAELTAGLSTASEDLSLAFGMSFGTTDRDTGRRGRGG